MYFIVRILNCLYRNKGRYYNFGEIDNIEYIYRYGNVKNNRDHYNFGVSIDKLPIFKILNIHAIVLDISFDTFDDNIKKFVICHELGHEYLHISKIINDELIGMEEKILVEHEADMFAVERISWGMVHRSLKFLLNDTIINNPQNNTLIESIKARIQLLEINKD